MKLIRRDHSGISLTEDGAGAAARDPRIPQRDGEARKTRSRPSRKSGRRRSESPLMRALPCTGCRKFCTASAACVRRPTWIFAWWTTSSNPLSCSRRGVRTSSLPRGRATSTATGHRSTTTRCTPSCRRTIPPAAKRPFPIEEFDGKEFLMPYGRFDIDVNAALSSPKR